MIDMVTRRKGEMTSMESQGERTNIEFDIPSRGIIGLRTNVLTASQGEAIMAHRFKEYQPYKGDIERRVNGSMIALETGNAFAYAIDKLQDRGKFFIDPGEDVYMGQVVGEHVHDNDLVINEPRGVSGVYQRRRARRGHSPVHAHPQDHPRPRPAEKGCASVSIERSLLQLYRA